VSDLWRVLVAELERDPVALDRLRELVAMSARAGSSAAVYGTVTLAAEVGCSPRAVLGAIHRGELRAVKRGRGYVIARDAVDEWARAPDATPPRAGGFPSPRRRAGAARGPAREALDRLLNT
jgi:excisionase family DNA binding protein